MDQLTAAPATAERKDTTTRDAIAGLCALVVIAGALFLGLYALTPLDDRPELLGRFAESWPLLLVGVPQLLLWLRGEQMAATTAKLHRQVDTVVEQTNGNLTNRLESTNAELERRLVSKLLPAIAQSQGKGPVAGP